LLVRYLLGSAGLLLVAFGVAWSVLSNMGTQPLSCPAYVLASTGRFTIGNWTIFINMFYLLVQLAVFRRRFKAKYLMQILATVVFGYMIDFSMWCFGWMVPSALATRLLLIVLSCVVTALGVSIEVIAQSWMLSAEMTVYAISKTYHTPFDRTKVVMDSLLVIVTLALAYAVYGNPFGFGQFEGMASLLCGTTDGIVVGFGTLVSAILPGALMRFTNPVADRLMDAIIDREIFGKL